jgi:hypothetical protein
MATPNLDELYGTRKGTRGRPAKDAARRVHLHSKAQNMATVALRALHQDDYDALYAQAKAKVGL